MLDFVDIDEDLTEEERMIRDTTRKFVEEKVDPDIEKYFLEETFPKEVIPEMGDLGFFGANLEGYGLPNVSETAYGVVMRELEAGDSAFRSMVTVQSSLVMYAIYRFGTDSQKERLLPTLADGTEIGCFGLTEPEHGSNPSAMESRAQTTEDGYLLNGTKQWITNATFADIALVWAKDASADGTPVRGFLVDTDVEGCSINKIDGKLSMRASETGEIHLNDAFVPEENVLDIKGMKGPLSCLNQARYGLAWGVVGAARDAFETAREYALKREQFNQPIAGFQLQQEKLAEMATQITLGQVLAYRLATLKERGDLQPQQVSMAKRNNVRMAREQIRVAREMLGGNGITCDYSPMRHMLNMETVYTLEGTHDIHSLILGEELTGISAFQ